MNSNPIAIELKAIAARLRGLFPEASITFDAGPYPAIHLHRVANDLQGEAIMQRIGIARSTTSVLFLNAVPPKYTVEGSIDGLNVCVYCTERVSDREQQRDAIDAGA